MLSIANLRTFVSVAESGGVRLAAERLGRTPSAVSMALKQLEAGVGSTVFEGDRKVRLTKVGEFTLETARNLLKYYDNSCASIRAFSRDEISRCTVAAVTSFAGTVLPEVIMRVRQRSANFEAILREVHSAKIPDTVADGLVDVGFGRICVVRPDVEATPILHESYSVVCRADHRFASFEQPVRWQDLAAEDFISNESYDPYICDGLAGAHRDARFHVSSVSSAFALVAAKVGVTILPQLAGRIAPSRISFVPLADRAAVRVLGAFTRKGKNLSPATQTLIETTRLLISEWADDLHITDVTSQHSTTAGTIATR